MIALSAGRNYNGIGGSVILQTGSTCSDRNSGRISLNTGKSHEEKSVEISI